MDSLSARGIEVCRSETLLHSPARARCGDDQRKRNASCISSPECDIRGWSILFERLEGLR